MVGTITCEALSVYRRSAKKSRFIRRDSRDGPAASIGTLMHAERFLDSTAPNGSKHTGAIVWGRGTTTDAGWKFRANWPVNFRNPVTSGTAPGTGDAGCVRHGVASLHTGGAHVLMCDGAVRFLNQSIGNNAAAGSTTTCLGMTTTMAGPGFVWQNLFFINDRNPVADF
jgi:prepilin-type processing-associated H-X9-DG protein